MERNRIYYGDCLERMSMFPDFSIDRVITDPPYALGSEVIIQENSKPDYKRAQDFMNKWEMPTGEFWEDWFEEAMRILKYGGYLVMFGMDRQQFMFEYYAKLAGFIQCQSLYWYYTSNMPKGADLSKAIDKKLGLEREVVGISSNHISKNNKDVSGYNGNYGNNKDVTAPASPLAKKYNGYKYGVAPLKQTCETIMIFQKPYLDSCPGDILSGDERATCGAVNIGECYVPTADRWNCNAAGLTGKAFCGHIPVMERKMNEAGRYPAQTFIDSGTGEILDRQSGIVTSGAKKAGTTIKDSNVRILNSKARLNSFEASSGGCSRILHVCDYDQGDYDIMNYFSKVSPGEREDCDHPTMKPQKLIRWLVRLFKTTGCVILDPFAGSGTVGVACINLGVDYIMIEKKKEYFEVACERMKYQNRALFI